MVLGPGTFCVRSWLVSPLGLLVHSVPFLFRDTGPSFQRVQFPGGLGWGLFLSALVFWQKMTFQKSGSFFFVRFLGKFLILLQKIGKSLLACVKRQIFHLQRAVAMDCCLMYPQRKPARMSLSWLRVASLKFWTSLGTHAWAASGIVNLLLLCGIRVYFEACLQEILKVLEFVRFAVEGWYCVGSDYWAECLNLSGV